MAGLHAWTVVTVVVYFVVMAVVCTYGIHRLFLLFLYFRNKKRAFKPMSRFEKLPRVTVQLPIFNERYVVERLIDSVVNLDYPRELLEIQVLDDSTDDTVDIAADCVEKYRSQGVDIVHIHRKDRVGFKAGALESGLKIAKGEYVAIFDADFISRPDMLMKCIHHFTDPKIGLVQTRWGHINRSFSLLTKTQAMMLDGHFMIEHTARNRSGRFMNFNGTGGLWRKEAIIDAGGWQHDTLTEDLDLSYRAQMRGWQFVFLPQQVSPAELPVEMNGFKSQQHRWTKGQVQTAIKMLPRILSSNLPLKVKAEAFFHLTSSTLYLFVVVMSLVLLPIMRVPQEMPGWNSWRMLVFFHLPFLFCATISACIFYTVSQRAIKEVGWVKSIIMIPVLMAVGIGISLVNAKAVLEALFGIKSAFIRTPKYGVENRGSNWRKKKMYRGARNFLPALEVAFAAYLCFTLYTGIRLGLWSVIPFLTMFLFGYAYVGFWSIFQVKPKASRPVAT